MSTYYRDLHLTLVTIQPKIFIIYTKQALILAFDLPHQLPVTIAVAATQHPMNLCWVGGEK